MLTGAVSGAVNGFFGAGGGTVAVPMLSSYCGLEYKNALAASVSVMLPISLCSAFIYLRSVDITFSALLPYLIGGLAGGLIGGKIFKKVPNKWLRRCFALFIIYGGVKNLFLT